MTYFVYTKSFSGMTLLHGEYDELDEAKDRVQRRKAWLESLGCEIDPLSPTSWEVIEPENCAFIPDYCGVLRINTTAPAL